jgi:hypothetical protein
MSHLEAQHTPSGFLELAALGLCWCESNTLPGCEHQAEPIQIVLRRESAAVDDYAAKQHT